MERLRDFIFGSLHEFLVEKLHYFFLVDRLRDFFWWIGCMILCAERLRDFVCVERLRDFSHSLRLHDLFLWKLRDFFWQRGCTIFVVERFWDFLCEEVV